MKHLDLFSGIGGFTVAARSLGIQTIQFVEIHDYCCHVLTKNFPNIPIHRDIHTFYAKPNQFDLITGGSPCQDLSLAGTRTGITGERSSLWFEMLPVIKECRPKYVVWENVKGAIYAGGLAEVLRGLSELSYSFDVEIISAAEVGAPHLRERVFVVAYAYELFGKTSCWSNQVRSEIKAVTHPDSFSGRGLSEKGKGLSPHWSSVESPVCGVAYGLPHRLDRLAVLGNSVVPTVAAIALKRVLFLEEYGS
ncbi:DNA-methyltransferase Dcm [Synechococcus sp. PCC 7502]|uniref:DNA cytosine methyltransferase n=1 Tax=Synechococcus sp. PCC 7502 TaxID=1173263 RepID=UPI00029FF4DF|nr:DNA cytosine methyltransferase [Synechococcus sp. PCC 7502]AFY73595.1 DNA-methyltransferase Dcm [Synechococcus sp. PCC 7502]